MIATPALADNNNGNWRTAWRWQRFLAPLYPTRLVKTWPDALAAGDGAMIALHARRSADAIAAWHARHGGDRLALVLTGTDLYRDIDADPAARLLRDRPDIFLDHVGDALDPALARQAEATMVEYPNYRWLGGRPHEEARRRIQRAHLLIHPSRMEGGARLAVRADDRMRGRAPPRCGFAGFVASAPPRRRRVSI